MEKRKTKKKSPLLVVLLVIMILIAAAAIGIYVYYEKEHDLVYSQVIIEADTTAPDISEFLKKPAENVSFSQDSSFDVTKPGDYQVTIVWQMPFFGQQEYPLTVTVQDTTAPLITAAMDSFQMYTSQEAPSLADFVEGVTDISDCTYDFAKDYDFTSEGSFDVEIVATDASGNSSSISIPVTVIDDTTAPVIEGVEPLTISQGDSVSYKKNITVTDDYDTNPTLEVDSSQVNTDKRGTYTVTYIATDAAGNVAKKSTTVKIVSAKIAAATEETVNAMADSILATIITDGMDQKQQARAVFDWVVDNITYSESAGIDDLYSAAYKGMYNRIGDCTVKQKTAEVMLNRLGIKNMEIEKIRDTRGHYWLLIDIGEGWYHYDPNLQLDGTLIFYWHDADLWAYSNAHKNTHNYDPSKYPTIQ